ncbi:unnamed protein product [Ranitomeya imitator]|uniref:Uncharacterized protein n=1 Tax=Ranitomeya imitator TaxID=111125 RepID=A0ABN9MGP5_9NEOB|nr:unnamed protein product [Ranitomeya imitator]
MRLPIIGKNQNIVQIYNQEFIKISPEDIMHEGLKNRWSIRESEWHHKVLKMAFGRVKRSFPFITLLNTNKIICPSEVNLGKPTSSLNRSKQIGKQRIASGFGQDFMQNPLIVVGGAGADSECSRGSGGHRGGRPYSIFHLHGKMTPALTDTVPQEPGVHFSPSLGMKSLSADINVCVDNSKTTSKASSSSLACCDPTLCLQEDFIGLQLEEALSSTHYQTIFLLSSSDMNVEDSSSFPLKTEQDTYRQRLHAKHDTLGRKVKRELFPGTVSKVLADVNKLWDISVTEDEGVHRLSGRIDGQSLAIPFASDCTLPNFRCISPLENKLQKSSDDAKVLQLRYLNRQQELLSRAQRSRKRLQLLLARYTVDHCSQQISGLVKQKIGKLNVHHNSATHSCTGVQTQPDVVVGLIENACVNINDEATLECSSAIKKFSVPAAKVLHCIQQELDSDVTESSSDDDWEEKPKNVHD